MQMAWTIHKHNYIHYMLSTEQAGEYEIKNVIKIKNIEICFSARWQVNTNLSRTFHKEEETQL
jgi:hypothetical protein